MTSARWVIVWSRVLRQWRRPIRTARERRAYASVVLHAFRAERRFRLDELRALHKQHAALAAGPLPRSLARSRKAA